MSKAKRYLASVLKSGKVWTVTVIGGLTWASANLSIPEPYQHYITTALAIATLLGLHAAPRQIGVKDEPVA